MANKWILLELLKNIKKILSVYFIGCNFFLSYPPERERVGGWDEDSLWMCSTRTKSTKQKIIIIKIFPERGIDEKKIART